MCKQSSNSTKKNRQSKIATCPTENNTLPKKKLLLSHLDKIYKANKGICYINELMLLGYQETPPKGYELLGDIHLKEALLETISILSEVVSESEYELFDVVCGHEEVAS